MAVFNGFFPIITSNDAARGFTAELSGSRKADWVALRRRLGITRETWSLQQTPLGSFMLVWFETDDVGGSFGGLVGDDSEFAMWYKRQILEHTGVDLNVPRQDPPPELLIDWSR